MPLQNGVPLPHEGRARYVLPNSHAVVIDLDSEHIVIEVHKKHLHELKELGWAETKTLTLQAGDLQFFYYLKTPAASRWLNSLDVRMN
jgi:hypothetical protein